MLKREKFNHRLENVPHATWSLLVDIDNIKGQWLAGAKLTPSSLDTLQRFVLITSTGASTRIEGARLSDEEVNDLMRGITLHKLENRDEQEVRGYYELLKNVFDSHESISLNEGTIHFMHRELLKYVDKDKDDRGQYKKQENKVVVMKGNKPLGTIFDTTAPHLTKKEMLELLEWTNHALDEKKYHPLFVIANFIVEFLKIHPFHDGNGRLSRILTNLLLLKYDYNYVVYTSHEKFIEANKQDYYVALRKSQRTIGEKNENINPFFEFFFRTLLQQSQEAIDLFSQENATRTLTENQEKVLHYLQKTRAKHTPMEIAQQVNIPQPTVRQALQKMLKLNIIERTGKGRSTKYSLII